MIRLNVITECYGHKLGGLARYEKMVIDGLSGEKGLSEGITSRITYMGDVKKKTRMKQLQFLLSESAYKKSKPDTDELTHLLNQQLGISLNFVPMSNVIVTVHDLAFLVPEYYNRLSYLDKVRYQLVKRGLQRADWIITDATFTKQEIIKYLRFPQERIFIVPLGVDADVFHKKKIEKQERQRYRHYSSGPVILYVGSEIPRMNFPVLLKAFALVRKEFPTAILIKVGEAKSTVDRRHASQMIESLKIQDAVIFVEHVSEDDLVNYYNCSDIFVYPISYTGYGLPVLESLACGCPVITTTTSTLPEVIGDAGLLFDPQNVQQLKEHIWLLIKNKTWREKLQRKGFSHVKHLIWKECVFKTINVYKFIQEHNKLNK